MRKITILGMGQTAAERCIDIEKYCEDTEIWSLNNAYGKYPHLIGKFARYFELHKWDYLKTWDSGTVDHFRALNGLNCPVYVMEPIPIVRNQVDYKPMEVFRHHGVNYFLGSPSLMLALALYEHDNGEEIEEIRSWGIDTQDPTHAQQRASWAWWLSQANRRNISLTGTALNFMAEPEKDEGLRGLREYLGNKLSKEENKQ